MKIVIIEDEKLVARDLEASIRQLVDGPLTITQLHSVSESTSYFRDTPSPDLIFSDIQLGDGLSFEIFMAVPISAPVIFCTAYDEYALDAFKTNGIDYILKPFIQSSLARALQKYHQLKKAFSVDQSEQFSTILQKLTNKETPRTASVLVYYQDRIIPIKLEEIALFYLENEVTHLLTFSGGSYHPKKKLEELDHMTGNYFFRANRQFLVSRRAIKDVSSFFSRKLHLNLSIPFKESIVVSKAKASQFLEWLEQVD